MTKVINCENPKAEELVVELSWLHCLIDDYKTRETLEAEYPEFYQDMEKAVQKVMELAKAMLT